MKRLLFLVLPSLVLACGGDIFTPGDAGGDAATKDSGSDGEGIDASIGICPSSPPTSGAPCSHDQVECEYGSNPSPDCNQLFRCNSGKWEELTFGTICPPQSDCPASYASITSGAACSPMGLGCAYPEGTCFCGNSLMVQSPAWTCAPETNVCPSPRPDLGTPCSEPGQQCDYGGCAGGVTLECSGGIWTQSITPCPG